jgi:large subunit ribosomal protein L22
MKAVLSNLRISPRKVRLVADLIKGRTVDQALVQLGFLAKRSAAPVAKLLNSAAANAAPVAREGLVVKEIRVDSGATLKRIRPRAFGRAYRINKRTSRIMVTLAPAPAPTPRAKKA